MTKKILFIVTQSEFGGAQHFLSHLATALDRAKYNIVVGAGSEGDDETGLLSFLEKKGINTRHLKYLRRGVNPLFDFCLGIIEIYKLIKKEKPGTLFLCSSKAGALGALAGRLAGVKNIVYRIGGWTFNDPWPWWKRLFYKLIEKISARWKDVIVVNADCHRKQAIELGIRPRKKIVTIYNGIGNLEFLSREEARDGIFNFQFSIFNQFSNPNFQLVGTIANLYPAKGLKYLVEAANLLKDRNIKFIIIGEGREGGSLENLIKKYNLENNFFFVGIVPGAYKYLKAFDIFVLPSVKEGFPWTILEAMAAEVPIVATKVGAIPEIQPGLLVEPGNPKELSDAIKKLLENEDLREKLVSQAKKVVEEKFTLDKMVKKIEKLF